MSEKMYPIPFKSLMNWIVTEYAREGEIFGVHTPYYASGKTLPIFSERIETPFGPAAGPNSQLAQNIIAAYFAGARFFEVKTVQKMDGAELAACVPRPCILAADEGYNQEWSTELDDSAGAATSISRRGVRSRFSPRSTVWATPTDSCSTCPSAMISKVSKATRSTPTSTI